MALQVRNITSRPYVYYFNCSKISASHEFILDASQKDLSVMFWSEMDIVTVA